MLLTYMYILGIELLNLLLVMYSVLLEEMDGVTRGEKWDKHCADTIH